MYCPDCGEAEQTANSFCRKCGAFLGTSSDVTPFSLGGTPGKQLSRSIFINAAIGLVSFLLAIWIFFTFKDLPQTYGVVYIAGILLNFIAFLELYNVILLTRLKKRLNLAKTEGKRSAERPVSNETAGLSIGELREQPQAYVSDIVPPSVVDDTTELLIKRER
jgi:hypothetical protein